MQRVKVSEGGAASTTSTSSRASRYLEAGVGLDEAIRSIVAGVMSGRRHVVRIVWAELA